MTRKQLEDLGLTKEQADSVMKINGDDIENAKGTASTEIKNLQTEVEGLKTQVGDRDKQLETLKASAGDNADLKKKIEDLQTENATAKATHESELNQLKIDFAVEKFGHLDILVNNAGIMDDMSPVGDMTDEMLDRVMKINGYAPIYAMRKAVQVFLKQEKGGNIINVTSVGVDHNTAGAAYAASKAAVAAVSRNVTFQYMSQKIRCNNIAPGGISTEISKSMGMPNMVGFGNVKKLLGIAPEMGSAEDIANAALYLASDESKYVNGAVITVDGGWTCL